jgi:putative DNA methylase
MPLGEIVTRGRLPHWYVPHAAHFVTYRLAGTIPLDVFENLRAKERQLLRQPGHQAMSPSLRRLAVHKTLFVDYDRYLDANRSVDWLARPQIASMIRCNLYHHHHRKYELLAYCVMPNHVHALFIPLVGEAAVLRRGGQGQAGSLAYGEGSEPWGERPDGRSPLSEIMHSLKSYTANQANAILERSGQFWQHESYDHWVRDEEELARIVEYINGNPVRAQLVQAARDWHFGSARDRLVHDGSECGYLGDLP